MGLMKNRNVRFGKHVRQGQLAGTAIYLVLPAIALPVTPASADSVLMDEVIVTAQKREQDAQDVGIAITTLSGRQLDGLGYTATADIIAQNAQSAYAGFFTFPDGIQYSRCVTE